MSAEPMTPDEVPKISLPWACLVPDNERHDILRTKGGGRRIGLTEKYRNALAAASLLAGRQWGDRPTIRELVHVRITLYEPDKRRRDIGNYIKLLGDCLTRVAFVDDSQITVLIVERGPVSKLYPRAEIQVFPIAA